MRIDFANLLARDFRGEVVLDLHQDLRADAEFAVHENVERVVDRAFRGILDRHHAVIRMPARHHIEDIGDADLRRVGHARAEFAARGLVGVRGLGAEVGDGQVFFERKGGGHNFAVNRPDSVLGQPAFQVGVLFCERAQQHLLALRRVDFRALGALHHADFVDEVGALVQHPDELVIEGVDLLADLGKGHGIADCRLQIGKRSACPFSTRDLKA